MKIKSLIILLITFTLTLQLHAGTHIWSGAQDGYWSNPANWSSGGAPSIFDAAPVVINFPTAVAARRQTTNDVDNLQVDVLAFYGAGYQLSATVYNLTLTGSQPPFPYAANVPAASGVTNEIDSSVYLTLATNISVAVGTGGTFYLDAELTGPGGFTKSGKGLVDLFPANGNDFQGTVNVFDGTIYAADAAPSWYGFGTPIVTIPGNLVIGDTNLTRSPDVQLYYDGQLGAQSAVTINPNGKLEAAGQVQARCVTMTGGQVFFAPIISYDDSTSTFFTNYGSFDCGSNLTSIATPLNTATISGGGTVYFSFTNNASPALIAVTSGNLIINADLYGYGALTKTGVGQLAWNGTGQYKGELLIQQGTLAVSGLQPFGLSSGVPPVTVSNGAQIIVQAPCYACSEFHLNGSGVLGLGGALIIQHDGAQFPYPIHVDSDATIVVPNAGDTMTFGQGYVGFYKPSISGAGNLTKKGLGTLQMTGNQTNQMTGTLFVDQGVFSLATTSGVAAVTSQLVIGHNVADGTTAEARMLNDYVLPTNCPVTVNGSGTLNIYGTSQKAGGIILQGGAIKTSTGSLALSADVLATNGLGSIISGNILLSGGKRTWHIAPGYNINVSAQISDVGSNTGFDVDGGGSLTLSGANTSLFGPISVKAGLLYARNDFALGDPAGGTFIAAGARLSLDGRNIGAEPITLNGDGGDGYGALSCSKTNTCNGLITLASNVTVNVVGSTDRLIFGGTLGGAGGLTKIGAGTLALTGNLANTYGGLTTVGDGVLELNKTGKFAVPGALVIGDNVSPAGSHFVRLFASSQICDTAPLTINTSGILDLGSVFGVQTNGSLAGSGGINLGFSTLVVGGNNADTLYSGTFTGFAGSGLVKQGAGKLSLTGASPAWNGSTFINGGTLSLNGSQALSPITINVGGTLAGVGVAGPIVANSGKVAPGNSTGLLNSGNLVLNPAATFEAEINGTNPGVTYDQLKVTGTVNLGNAVFVPKLGFGGAVSNTFVIISNDGNKDAVTGTFAGLAEGATLLVKGAGFKISYHGGDGNDVVLTQVSLTPPPVAGGVTKLPGGQMQLTGTGTAGLTYGIEANADLTTTNWTNIGTVQADLNGLINFTDTNAPSFQQRFYRLTAP